MVNAGYECPSQAEITDVSEALLAVAVVGGRTLGMRYEDGCRYLISAEDTVTALAPSQFA